MNFEHFQILIFYTHNSFKNLNIVINQRETNIGNVLKLEFDNMSIYVNPL